MNGHNKHTYSDWMFGGLMFLLCATLTVLQYRWTGQVAHAELIRLRGNLGEQSQALARAFDAELRASCDQLMPGRDELDGQTLQDAHLARFKSWRAANPRPIFSRIAVAVPARDDLALSLLDQKAGKFIRTNWPAEWTELQENLTDKLTRGSPPYFDPRGALMEFPARGGPPPPGNPRDPADVHWLILEMDIGYVRDIWLPELVAKYLNPDGQALNNARVQTVGYNSCPLYSSQTNCPNAGDSVAYARFNMLGRMDTDFRGPSRGGRWLLEAWHRPGVLEGIVSASRRRNLAVAVLLNLLMLATGIALVRHTRHSRQLAEAQMSFVANVSHELRTPLTVIRGAAHNMQRGLVHERSQIQQYSGLIIQHTEQLTDMIEQLLELGGVNKNRAALAWRTVALEQVLKDAAAAAGPDTQRAGCSVEFQIPATLPAVSGDASALRRVFQNLITNAAKHGGQGGWIGVAAGAVNGAGAPMVEVRVADRGPGIPAQEQAEVFKPFFRGAAAQAGQIRGSGLGLSLVREIVTLHHGHISVTSQDGLGATFTVRLPAAQTQAGQRQ
jgi:signal transduction histidine kinase